MLYVFSLNEHSFILSQVKVVDEEGKLLPVNQSGELCIRGYGIMHSYYGDEQATKKVIGEDRWYKTG